MNMAVYVLLLFILRTCSGSVIHIPSDVDSSKILEYYLCTEDGQEELVPGTILQLASEVPHVISKGQGCILKNITNVTITSNEIDTVANITCEVLPVYRIDGVRGFVFLHGSDVTLSNVHITQCGTVLTPVMLQLDSDTNNAAYFGINQTAVLLFSHVLRLKVTNIEISDYYGFAIIVVNSMGLSQIENVHVYNSLSITEYNDKYVDRGNHSYYGSGLLVYFHNLLDGLDVDQVETEEQTLVIMQSEFNNNTYYHDDFLCKAQIFRFQPSRVPIVAGAAITLYFTQDTYEVNVQLDAIDINGNDGSLSAGIMVFFINTPFQSHLLLSNSIIQNNTNTFFPCYGTGMLVKVYFTGAYISAAETSNTFHLVDTWVPLTVVNTTFAYHQDLRDKHSSTMYIGQNSQRLFNVLVELDRVKFLHNIATYNGICLYMETTYQPTVNSKFLLAKLNNILVYNNSEAGGITTRTTSSHIVFFRIGRATIEGNYPYNSSFINNYGTVITAFNSEVYLKGNVNFINNTASEGAGITLKSSSFLILADNSAILFQNNTAFVHGGAIYAIEEGTELFYCLIQIDTDKKYISELNLNVTFVSNVALRAGNSMFIRPLYICFQANLRVFVRHLPQLYAKIFDFQKSDINNEVSSPSSRICHCNVSSDGTIKSLCGIENDARLIYPGDTITVSLVALDDTDHFVVSQVEASLSTRISPVDPLPGWYIPPTQEINTIPANQCQTFDYTIMSDLNQTKGQLNFHIPRRPANTHVLIELLSCPTGLHLVDNECQCKPYFEKLGLQCDQRTKMIHFHSTGWVGIVHVTTNDTYFAYARYCPVGYCNTRSTAISVTDPNTSICLNNRKGILCGNCEEGYSALHGGNGCAICSNYSLFLLIVNIGAGFVVVAALFGLRLTLNMGTLGGIVFYANMFYFVKTIPTNETYFIPFLQVIGLVNLIQAFPACLYNGMVYAINIYIHFAHSIFLWSIVLVVTIIARSSTRLSRILSSSSVQVFMTLIHLSFAKILLASIDVLSFIEIHTENGDYIAWLYNGSVAYGTGIHIPLILIAICFTLCVIIPYTVVGLFGSYCLRFSYVNKFRPFIDTIHGPYKDKQRVWFGARLVLLVSLSLVSVVLRGQDLFYQLLLQLTLVLIFTCVQAYKQPFEKLSNNILDLWCMMNVLVLILINLYNSYNDDNVAQYLLLLELIVMNITIFCIIGFHVYLRIKKRSWCRKKAPSVQKGYDDVITEGGSIRETTSILDVDTEADETWFQLREPFIAMLDD